jgi:glucose-6-phosphate isomerase
MGISLEELRQGMLETLDNRELVLQLIAAGLASVERQDQVLYFWPYTQGLETFGFWFQQLWAESLGKRVTRDGGQAPRVPVPVPSLGPRDQHSTMQQLMEGLQPRWVWLWRDREPTLTGPRLEQSGFAQSAIRIGKTMGELVDAQATATEAALIQTQIPLVSLSITGLWPKTIGALFFLSELVVGGLGEALGINAFDQPGVELGKKLTKDLLSKGS